jgi:NADH-quinone oxidoreductase subunit C
MPDHETPREEIHKDEGAAHPAPSSTASLAADGDTPSAGARSVGAECADPVAAVVLEHFPGAVFHDSHGQPVVYVDRGGWHDVAQHLRDEQRFDQCVDVTVVDHLVDEQRLFVAGVEPERFEVVANFLSYPRNRRIRTICEVPADDPKVPSIVDLYPGMSFGEREAYDMHGIVFEGHPDLTRILMPDDWVGFPLRKDDAPARVPVAFKGDPSPQ